MIASALIYWLVPWELRQGQVPQRITLWHRGAGVRFLLLLFVLATLLGISVPQSGIKSRSAAVKVQSPIHWTARKFPLGFHSNLLRTKSEGP